MIARRIHHSSRAVALVIVLWVLVVVTALCLILHASVRSRSRQVTQMADQARAGQAILSALDLASDLLASDNTDVDCLTEPWAAGGEAAFSVDINGGKLEIMASSPGIRRTGLADESARLNANTASVDMLARLPGMTPVAAEAFVAAREALSGTIDAAAGGLAGPGQGLTGPIGDPAQLAAMLADAMASPASDAEGPAVAETAQYLTIYSRAWNLDANAAPRVNVNTATVEELTTRLGGELDQRQIQALVLSRDVESLHSVGELLTRDLAAPDDQGRTVAVPIMRGDFRRVVDHLTVTDEAVLPGLVNVNTAAAEVLACLPGMDPALAADLIDRRAALEAGQLRTVGWLLDVLTNEGVRQIAPHVTTRSAQFSLVAVYLPDGSATATCARATLERGARRNGVLYLETYRRIWDHRQEYTTALTAGSPGW